MKSHIYFLEIILSINVKYHNSNKKQLFQFGIKKACQQYKNQRSKLGEYATIKKLYIYSQQKSTQTQEEMWLTTDYTARQTKVFGM